MTDNGSVPHPLPAALDHIRTLLLDDERLVRAVAAGRRRGGTPRWRRTDLRYVDLKVGRRLQITTYDETQAHVRNVPPGPEAEAAVGETLAEPYGNWHVQTPTETVQLRVTKKGQAQVHVARREADPDASDVRWRAHDRRKNRLLDPSAPFLRTIGISDRNGRVKPSRTDKYRQIEEFLRQLRAAVDDALAGGHLRRPDAERPLQVVDLGCGNAYLTFAAYHYLAHDRGLPVALTGVDVKEQARERNSRLARELGWERSLRFVCSEIAGAEPDESPDVVLALHACDTATDDALAAAVRWRAPLVLAAPCCHHDLQRQLREAGEPPRPYALVARHGILRERVADVLTDSVRAALLRMAGYRVSVVEFVDSEHTPRNVLLRAVRTGVRAPARVVRDYRELVAAWGLKPALERRLEPELAEVLHE